ncbi:MAG: HpcH/HpaI aldolase/citrate lyase family protein [Streptosporangiaceae bacterium]
MSGRGTLTGVRGILESPILDERKWAKVPSIPADAVLLDLEDSVPPERKEEARARVLSYLDRPDFFGGRLPVPRPNPLDTPWGPDDLRALAGRGTRLLAYPKVRSATELREVRALAGGAEVVVIIETARAVLELETIAREPGVAGLILGPSDLAVDAGWTLFADGRLFADAYHYPKSKLALAGAAYGLPVYDTVFVPDLKDLGQVRTAALHARRLGFAGMTTFYPPHVDVINEVFSPSEEEVTAAREIVSAYERTRAGGSAALRVGGRAVIVQDYKRALRVLERAGG